MLTEHETEKRLETAKLNKSTNVNCIGFVLFMLGISDKEVNTSQTAYRIKQNLEQTSPLKASVFGVWSLEAKFYLHLAFIYRTNSDLVIYERKGVRQPVGIATIDTIVREYQNDIGFDRIESHYLKLKAN